MDNAENIVEVFPEGCQITTELMNKIFPFISIRRFNKFIQIPIPKKERKLKPQNNFVHSIDNDFFSFIKKEQQIAASAGWNIEDDIYTLIELKELIIDSYNEQLALAALPVSKKENTSSQIKKQSTSIGKYLTEKWILEDDKKYVLHIGQTCSGKTYQAIERLKLAESGCYLAPLRLLAWEIAETLNESGVKCDLITGEERRYVEGANITASTIEMLDYEKDYDIAVIDECFMVADKDRGKSWLKAILEVKAKEVHLILNEEVEELITGILTNAKKKFTISKYERLTKLEIDTVPYRTSEPKDKTIFVVFSRRNALVQKAQFEKRGYNVSVLYGDLPPETKKHQIQKFISGENSICISTDVIGMGLNLPCKHVCFLEMEKFDGVTTRNLNSIEIKQIGGRAGRYGYSDVGYVCATQPYHIGLIKSGISSKDKISKAFFGLDYAMFRDIPKKNPIDKLHFFKKLNCIPKELKAFIDKQDVLPLIEIGGYADIKKLDVYLQWILINSPIKKGNKNYFEQTLHDIRYKEKILPPDFLNNFHLASITDTTMLGYYEQHISEIDLFAYFYNHAVTSKLIDKFDFGALLKTKGEIIEKINAFLVDKSKSSIKKCAECNCEMDITWIHKKCNSCFYSERRNYSYY